MMTFVIDNLGHIFGRQAERMVIANAGIKGRKGHAEARAEYEGRLEADASRREARDTRGGAPSKVDYAHMAAIPEAQDRAQVDNQRTAYRQAAAIMQNVSIVSLGLDISSEQLMTTTQYMSMLLNPDYRGMHTHLARQLNMKVRGIGLENVGAIQSFADLVPRMSVEQRAVFEAFGIIPLNATTVSGMIRRSAEAGTSRVKLNKHGDVILDQDTRTWLQDTFDIELRSDRKSIAVDTLGDRISRRLSSFHETATLAKGTENADAMVSGLEALGIATFGNRDSEIVQQASAVFTERARMMTFVIDNLGKFVDNGWMSQGVGNMLIGRLTAQHSELVQLAEFTKSNKEIESVQAAAREVVQLKRRIAETKKAIKQLEGAAREAEELLGEALPEELQRETAVQQAAMQKEIEAKKEALNNLEAELVAPEKVMEALADSQRMEAGSILPARQQTFMVKVMKPFERLIVLAFSGWVSGWVSKRENRWLAVEDTESAELSDEVREQRRERNAKKKAKRDKWIDRLTGWSGQWQGSELAKFRKTLKETTTPVLHKLVGSLLVFKVYNFFNFFSFNRGASTKKMRETSDSFVTEVQRRFMGDVNTRLSSRDAIRATANTMLEDVKKRRDQLDIRIEAIEAKDDITDSESQELAKLKEARTAADEFVTAVEADTLPTNLAEARRMVIGAQALVTVAQVVERRVDIGGQISELKRLKASSTDSSEIEMLESQLEELRKMDGHASNLIARLESGTLLSNLQQANLLIVAGESLVSMVGTYIESTKKLRKLQMKEEKLEKTDEKAEEVRRDIEDTNAALDGLLEGMETVAGQIAPGKTVSETELLTPTVMANTASGKRALHAFQQKKHKELTARFEATGNLADIKVEALANAALGAVSDQGYGGIYTEQLLAASLMASGNVIAELATGEGKTTVACLIGYLQSFKGGENKGRALVLQPTELFAKRDGATVGRMLQAMDPEGYKVGIVTQDMEPDERREQYKSDIVYVSGQQFVFDVLHDLFMISDSELARGEGYLNITAKNKAEYIEILNKEFSGIMDEVDSVLIDQARTKNIISAGRGAEVSAERKKQIHLLLMVAADLDVGQNKIQVLSEEESKKREGLEDGEKGESTRYAFVVDPYTGGVDMTLSPEQMKEQLKREYERDFREAGIDLDTITEEELEDLVKELEKAVEAQFVYGKETQYVIQGDPATRETSIILVSQESGVNQFGQRLQEGLHAFLEAKHGLPIHAETHTESSATSSTIYTLLGHFCGMTGTATQGEAMGFFDRTYGLAVKSVPTHNPTIRLDSLVEFVEDDQHLAAFLDGIMKSAAVGAPVLVPASSIRLARLCHKATLAYAYAVALAEAESEGVDVPQAQEAYDNALSELKQACEDYKAVNDIDTDYYGGAEEFLGKIASGKVEAKPIVLQQQFDAKSGSDIVGQQVIVKGAAGAATVTIATNIAGRGTNISLKGDVKSAVGLNVILPNLVDSLRIEMQNRGRAGRQGGVGQSSQVVSRSQFMRFITEAFGDNQAMLTKAKELDFSKEKDRNTARLMVKDAQAEKERKSLSNINLQAEQDQLEFRMQIEAQ